jgi:hypothetical protein
MLFLLACLLILVAFGMLGKYLWYLRQPKVKATIDEVVQIDKNWWAKRPNKIVLLSFSYLGINYERKKTYLLLQDAEIGDSIIITLNPKKPEDFKPFYPKLELIGIFLIGLLGIGLLWFCIFMTDWLTT